MIAFLNAGLLRQVPASSLAISPAAPRKIYFQEVPKGYFSEANDNRLSLVALPLMNLYRPTSLAATFVLSGLVCHASLLKKGATSLDKAKAVGFFALCVSTAYKYPMLYAAAAVALFVKTAVDWHRNPPEGYAELPWQFRYYNAAFALRALCALPGLVRPTPQFAVLSIVGAIALDAFMLTGMVNKPKQRGMLVGMLKKPEERNYLAIATTTLLLVMRSHFAYGQVSALRA
jgi:hypothetical protein